MPNKHRIVEQGDCIFSIAEIEGIDWKKIWYHPENIGLRGLRKNPNILRPGDEVVVPDREIHEKSKPIEKRHCFRIKGIVEIRVRIHDLNGPRRNEPYHLKVDGKVYPGVTNATDSEGLALCRIPATAKRADLIVGEDEDLFELLIGYMNPTDTVSGVHARLENMGFDAGGFESDCDDQRARAMAEFLRENGASHTGVARSKNKENLDKIIELYSV
jgi:N-acetylmuramoyl-L-alanine amidase